MSNYILKDGKPVMEPDILKWAKWLESSDEERVLRKDKLDGDVEVSTVFLGFDRSFGDGPPVLWETNIFGGPHDKFRERYTSEAEAIAGHMRAIALARTQVAS